MVPPGAIIERKSRRLFPHTRAPYTKMVLEYCKIPLAVQLIFSDALIAISTILQHVFMG